MIKKNVNVSCELEMYTQREYKNCNFQQIFLNWIILIIIEANMITFGGLIGGTHVEGTVSQIFYLSSSFHFMKCRKLS